MRNKMERRYMIPRNVLETVQGTIEQYYLLDKTKPAIVAFSGGKDSSATALILKEIGYDIRLAVIGGIWKNFDMQKVGNIAETLGFDPLLLDVRSNPFQEKLTLENKEGLRFSLQSLTELGKSLEQTGIMGNVSPCTACYNIKVNSLETAAKQFETDCLVFGHHQDDALASFLKSAIMYDDYHIFRNQTYDTRKFTGLVEQTKRNLNDHKKASQLIDRWKTYVDENKAGTDEPARQPVKPKSKIQIVRPLYRISESDIISIRDRNKISVEGSGCAHGIQLTRTAREIVHQDLIPHLSTEVRRNLIEIVDSSLDKMGSIDFNVRKNRDMLLPGYKAGGCKL